MKNILIAGIAMLIVGFLAGFAPEHSKISRANQEAQVLKDQLDACKRAEAIGSFRNRAALLYVDASRNNFSIAGEKASKDFTAIRVFANQTSDANLKQSLEDVLSSRDAIIAGLAKADPAVTATIQEMFMKLQKLQP